jgi:hypothetical protein
VENSVLEEKTVSIWKGKSHQVSIHRWINGIPIRDDAREPLLVNYFSLEIKNQESGKTTFYNSWITNKPVDEHNVSMLAECGRARWKIENEHNNVLKTTATILNTTSAMAKTMPERSFLCSTCCPLCFTRYWIYVIPAGKKPAPQSAAGIPFLPTYKPLSGSLCMNHGRILCFTSCPANCGGL